MELRTIISLVVLLVVIAVAFVVFWRNRKHRNDHFYDDRWKIYHPDEE